MNQGFDDNHPNPYASPSSGLEQQKPAKPGWDNRQLATLGERFLGSLIDGIIMVPILFGAGFVLGMVLTSFGIVLESFEFDLLTTVIGALMGIGVFLAVQGYFLASKGQTVGKMAMGTQIVSEKDGEIVPFVELILKRYLPIWVLSYIPVVGSFIGLIDALFIFRENRKCLHDEIAGTKVIKL